MNYTELARTNLPEIITGKDFSDIIGQDLFSNKIVQLNQFTRQERREAAFNVYKTLGYCECELNATTFDIKGTKVTIKENDFIKGKSHSVSGRPSICIKDRNKLMYPLIGIHTHTMHKYNIRTTVSEYMLSSPDLYNLAYRRWFLRENLGLDIEPLEILSTPIDENISALLLVQEKTAEPQNVTSCIQTYKHLRTRMLNRSIITTPANILEETGKYNAAYLFFDERKRLPVTYEEMEKFSFEVRIYVFKSNPETKDKFQRMVDLVRMEGLYGYLMHRILP